MLAVFLQVLPFFAIIGLGWGAGRRGFFPDEATGWLTRFVFFFALPAMLFSFAARMELGAVISLPLILAYLCATLVVYGLGLAVALRRGEPLAVAAFEAHCAICGNVGFLGLPMLGLLMGERAIIVIMQVIAVDLLVFTSLLVILISAKAGPNPLRASLGPALAGVARNPMMQAIFLGFLWSGLSLPMPGPMDQFVEILGAAATPGALFAIGASLASKSAVRPQIAGWISFLKLALHPAAVTLAAFAFGVDPVLAAPLIAAAALPVAGNVFMLAQHYGIAPQRVSASILISTAASVLTLSLVLTLVLR